MTTQHINYDRSTYILVVDDDQTLLKFFKIHLNKFFSRVIVVKNAKEAVLSLKEKQIDLVISDIKMPRTDGFQLIKKVRNHDPSIPVFLVSGALLSEDQIADVDEKADAFLRKPFSVDELHDFISKGLKIKKIYDELHLLVPDKKKLREVIKGHINVRELKEDIKKEKAQELLEQLKAC